jgi:transposase-like protein
LEEAGVDVVEFEEWLFGAAKLTPPQRRQAFRWLALAEASASPDGDGSECGAWETQAEAAAPEIGPGIAPELARSVAPAAASEGRSGSAGVAEAGRRHVAEIGCPHCANRDVILWGKASGLPRYRCRGCGRTFNGLTKTPLAHLHKREKWQAHAQSMIDGNTISKAAERCEVAYKTAFRWRHRFLEAISSDKPKTLSGIVEGDETFILESFKGKRSGLPRKSRKRGGKAAKRGLSAEQIPVIVARDRSGATIDGVLPKLDRASITAVLGGVVTPANQFCCDGGKAIVGFARKAGIPHHVLPAPGKPNPDAPDLHINNVNAYHGRLKEWMRRFHGVATKNLPNYLGWRRALEAMGNRVNPDDWILAAVGMGHYQQIKL